MNVLQLNKYITLNGGSETVMSNISEIFNNNGDVVYNVGFHKENQPYIDNNVVSIGHDNLSIKDMFSNKDIENKVLNIILENDIDLIICHNVYHHFPILNIFKKIKNRTKAKLVMILHDPKVVCPIHTLLLNGTICEKCKDKNFYQVLKNKCKDNSFLKSFALHLESEYNNRIFDAYKYVDVFISPSHFLRSKIYELGFKHKIEVLHNPIKNNELLNGVSLNRNSILYAGRLSEEKGIENFINVMIETPNINYRLAGTGPFTEKIIELSRKFEHIDYLGFLTQEELTEEMNKSSYLYIPSMWYENNPMIILEAMSKGLPVIGSNYGGIPELLNDGRGFVVNVDDKLSNIQRIKEIIAIDNEEYEDIIVKAKKFTNNLTYSHYYRNFLEMI